MGMEAVPTPAVHVREVLARAQNPFDITDAALSRLESAVACHVELHGWRQRKAPAPSLRCSSYRHIFLLRDGTLLPLWELRYDSGSEAGAPTLYEVYENEEALLHSEHRVLRAQEAPATGPYRGVTGGSDPHGPAGAPEPDSSAEHVPVDFLLTTNPEFGRRAYDESDSPDHARRLLRRAENGDRPGDDVSRLLATARGHQILPVPRPQVLAQEWQVWCSLYEHAFLLADGSEISLYELEHDLSGTGELVCEVYLDESFADQAARRLARDHGFGP